MRHVVTHVLENNVHLAGGRGSKIATPCHLVLIVAQPDTEPGDFIEVEGPQRWCPKCLAAVRGDEANVGLPPDVGTTESDGELGEIETDNEIGELEVEENIDHWVGSTDEDLRRQLPPQ